MRPLTPPPSFLENHIAFFSEKPSLKPVYRSKICNMIFWFENDPQHPLELVEKFIRSGTVIRHPSLWRNGDLCV